MTTCRYCLGFTAACTCRQDCGQRAAAVMSAAPVDCPMARDDGWAATGWWRAVQQDGRVWAESSSEAEIRHGAKGLAGGAVEQLLVRGDDDWWVLVANTPHVGQSWCGDRHPDGVPSCTFPVGHGPVRVVGPAAGSGRVTGHGDPARDVWWKA